MKHSCTEEAARPYWDWILARGGVAVWYGVNVSNPGKPWSTPALTDGKPTTKPTWQAANEPGFIVTDPDDITLYTDKKVERFHVDVQEKRIGYAIRWTEASTRRIRAALNAAGEGAYYTFDHATQEVVILVPESIGLLSEYARQKGWGDESSNA